MGKTYFLSAQIFLNKIGQYCQAGFPCAKMAQPLEKNNTVDLWVEYCIIIVIIVTRHCVHALLNLTIMSRITVKAVLTQSTHKIVEQMALERDCSQKGYVNNKAEM